MFLYTHRQGKLITQELHVHHGSLLGGWGGVGWDNNVHVPVHTQARQAHHTRAARSSWFTIGGVGWGGIITLMFLYTHTCSEISYRITDVECIERAKNTSFKPDRNRLMIGKEKLCEGNLSTSLLEGLTSSDAAQSDYENRTVVWFEKRHAGSWLGRSPSRKWKIAGTFSRHHGWVFVGPCHPCAHGPPANEKEIG